MNDERRDDLDREIDEALATMVSGEPRRVSAASVRSALRETRRPGLPAWFAVAAVLILAIGAVLKSRSPAEKTPEVIARSAAPMARPTPSIEPAPIVQASSLPSQSRRRPQPDVRSEPPYEGLPRLVVDSIDLPDPLETNRLDADALQIDQIEITPLQVSTLADDREPKQ